MMCLTGSLCFVGAAPRCEGLNQSGQRMKRTEVSKTGSGLLMTFPFNLSPLTFPLSLAAL